MKRFRLLCAIFIAFAALAVPTRAFAANGDETHPVADPALPGSVKIDANYAYTGSVITGPALAKPRTLNAYQSATFVQSWLATAIFGKPVLADPPASVPVFLVEVTGLWGSTTKTTLPVYYANQGTNVWISLPAPIGSTGGASPTPTTLPKPSKWFVAPDRVKQAFEGTAKLIATAGTADPSAFTTTTPTTVTSSTTVGAAAAGTKSSSSSATGWIIIAVIAVVVIGGAVALQLSRKRSSATKPKPV